MRDLTQYVFAGLSVGCIYAIVALGLVIVANVTGVFNFATGEYVMLGAMITAVTQAAGWPGVATVIVAVVGVAALAVAQERLTVAPVRGRVGPLGLVIASLGVGVAIRGVALLIWKEDVRPASPWQTGTFDVFGATVANQALWIYLASGIALAVTTVLFTRTDIGRAMRASAINPMAARLTGIRIGTTSMMAFGLAGALCGLVATVSASTTVVRWDAGISIGLVGFIAAALAGFGSPIRAVFAGLGLGLVETLGAGLISTNYRDAIVYSTLIIFLLARDLYGSEGFISRALKSRRASSAGSEDAPQLREEIKERIHNVEDRIRSRAVPHEEPTVDPIGRLRALIRRRRISPMIFLPPALLLLAAFFPSVTSDVGDLDTAVAIVIAAMAATGLGLIMGLAGQFSLGQALFMLVSGYTAALLTADRGWDPLVAMIVAVAASVVLGFLVGWITLRLEGLNLALATLALLTIALVVARKASFTNGDSGVNGVSPFSFFGNVVEEPKSYYLLCLGMLTVMLLIARNVWYSRMGRTLRAVGIDESAAESIGLDASRLKLKVFVLGSAMAGVAGVMGAYYLQFASPSNWDIKLTIDLVTYVIVGGVISPYGAVVGAVVVGSLQYYFRQHIGSSVGGDSSTWEILLSGALLIFFVLVFRQGLVAIPRLLIARLQRARGRQPVAEGESGLEAVLEPQDDQEALRTGEIVGRLEPLRKETPLVVVENLTKRFGSLEAVSDVSFSLRPGYVTALIGPNGAGKSTIINMLSGTLLPSDGAVGILGHPVVGLLPKDIAQLGLARTYQTPRLFEGMTLLETVMLARDRYGSRAWLAGAALRTPRARRDEVESREQALAWLAYVGLAEDAGAIASSLTTGKQRLAELARALATEPTVLLLDEPAAGLDGGETRALAEIIRNLADTGMAVLLVEHDMGMVMSIADHVVVIEEGKKIAEGVAEDVANNQTVIDAYLGVVHA